MTCITTPSYSLMVNGVLCGFLGGKKGIRQGDPISPLLFVICMEYLSRIFEFVSHMEGFKFYRGCKGMKLCHLCFADDLILFSEGDYFSMISLLRGFETFLKASGLQANKTKTELYAGNMRHETVKRILVATGFVEGQPPFRYLGVPISARSLKIDEYEVLTEKIISKVRVWGSRHLSYAARAILVNNVLLSLHTYWARIFVIPKGVINKIIALCRNFLWDGKLVYNRSPL